MSEGVPVSLETLVPALLGGHSRDAAERQMATTHLAYWATQPQYYSFLTHIFSAPPDQLDLGPAPQRDLIRLQAVLQLKNGLDKYWRRGANHAIPQQEKHQIRAQLLRLVNEPDRVSLEYGITHPEPLSARLVLHRSLLFLHETIKALCSNRLMKGRAIMAQVGAILFPNLGKLHTTLLNQAVQNERSPEPGLAGVEDWELAVLSFKILGKLFLHGFKDPVHEPEARDFFHSLLPTFTALHAHRLSLLPTTVNLRLHLLTKHVNAFVKLYRRFFKQDPTAFTQLGQTNDIVDQLWSGLRDASQDVENMIGDTPTFPYPERFVVTSLIFISATLGDWSGAPQTAPRPGFVEAMVPVLVTRFMPLRQPDLEKWSEEPEEWMNEEEAERWEFELRPCAEYVLQSLLAQYDERLGHVMAALLQQASSASPDSLDNLLLKDAVYCAIGKSPSKVQSTIDFDAWLTHSLGPEATSTDSNHLILRRRIAWLVGNWLSEDLGVPTHTKMILLLGHLISRNASTDPAIRLTAARSVGKYCSGWTFEADVFAPYLEAVMVELVDLLKTAEMSESQMRLNETLGAVIDRSPERMVNYAGDLVQILKELWSSSSESHFQLSILVTLTKLSEAIGEHSQTLHRDACSLIQLSNDPSSDAHMYLQEDALQLWNVLLRRSSVITPEMYQLLPTLLTLIQSGTDMLPRALAILESYLLLDGTQVCQLFSKDIFAAFEALLGDLSVDAVKAILHALETLFQSAPVNVWAAALEASGAFVKLLSPLENREPPLVTTKYLCTISRIVLAGAETFHQLIQATAARMQVGVESLWQSLVTEWLEKAGLLSVDNMSQSEQRKLTAFALAHLVPSTNPIILSSLGGIFSLWSGVLAERVEGEAGEAGFPDDYFEGASFDFADTLETTRRKQLLMADPVFALKTTTVLQQKLGEAESLLGQSAWNSYVGAVDEPILSEFRKRLEGSLVG